MKNKIETELLIKKENILPGNKKIKYYYGTGQLTTMIAARKDEHIATSKREIDLCMGYDVNNIERKTK